MTALVFLTRKSSVKSLLTFLDSLLDARNLHFEEGGGDWHLHLPSTLLLKVLISDALGVTRKYFFPYL